MARLYRSLPITMLATVLLLTSAMSGCQATKDDILTEGNLALWRKKPDEAIEKFKQVLKMDPADVDAHRGMANAYELKDEPKLQEQWLSQGSQLPNLAEQSKRFFDAQLEKHFLKQAETLRDSEGEGYASALSKAIQHNPKSKANVELARHYIKQGEALAKEGKLAGAADMLAKVAPLKVSKSLKRTALKGEMTHRLSLFRTGFDKEFLAKHQPELVAQGAFDAASKRFRSAAQANLPPNVRPNDPNLTRLGSNAAASSAYRKLLELFAKVAGRALPDAPPQFEFKSWQADSEGWVRRPSTYRYAASVAYDEAVEAIFLLTQHDRLHPPAKKAKAAPAPKADEAKAAPSKEAAAAKPAPPAAPAAAAPAAAPAPAAPPAEK